VLPTGPAPAKPGSVMPSSTWVPGASAVVAWAAAGVLAEWVAPSVSARLADLIPIAVAFAISARCAVVC
jgi:hypothetical protein